MTLEQVCAWGDELHAWLMVDPINRYEAAKTSLLILCDALAEHFTPRLGAEDMEADPWAN
jgi:hypothetical protein